MADRAMYPGAIKNAAIDLELADGTTAKTLLTAGANGSRISAISVVSTDTNAVILDVFYNDGSTDFLLGSVTVPTLSGTNGAAAAVSILNLTDMPFLPEDLSLFLQATHTIEIAPQVDITTALKVTVFAQYGDY